MSLLLMTVYLPFQKIKEKAKYKVVINRELKQRSFQATPEAFSFNRP